jgi:hypothetical protein
MSVRISPRWAATVDAAQALWIERRAAVVVKASIVTAQKLQQISRTARQRRRKATRHSGR